MFRNWSKILLVSMLVLVVGASLASATTSRTRSLANTGDYLDDDSNVNRWYSTLVNYGDQVNAEVGTFSGTFGPGLSDSRGLAWSVVCGEDGKWGTYRIGFNENALDHPGFWMTNGFFAVHAPGSSGNIFGAGDPNVSTPVNTWDLGGSWNIGDAMALGVGFTRSGWKWESDTPDTTLSNTWTTFGAGLSWTNQDNMVLDLLANFGSAGGEYTEGASKVEYDSKTAFEAAGRLFYDWKDDVTIPVVADFVTSKYSAKTSQGSIPTPNGDKLTSFMLGVGLDVDVNSDNTVIFAVEFRNMKWEYENPGTGADSLAEVSTTYLPTFRLGLESHINSWLTTRIGAAKHLSKRTLKDNGGKEVKDTPGNDGYNQGNIILAGYPYDDLSSFEWFLGCGFNVAEWTIDMELAHETPFSIGYWLTGYSAFDGPGPGPVGRISAVYNY